jgi:hypothetical protein
MTTDTSTHSTHDAAPFARLVKELTDLDYEPTFTDNPERTTYTATDGRLTATVDNAASPACADLTRPNDHDDPEWTLTLTATIPDRIQLMVLYAALNGDAVDDTTAVEALAAALGVDRDQQTTATAG